MRHPLSTLSTPLLITYCPLYSAGNPLNRLSYLRSSPSFLSSALASPKAVFLALDSLQPLCKVDQDGARRLHTLKWDDVKDYIGRAEDVFRGVDGKKDDEVPQLAVLGREAARFGKAKVGELSPEQKRGYFLNQVSSIRRSEHAGTMAHRL